MKMVKGENQFWFRVKEERVLFVDNLYVAGVEGLQQTLHQPQKHPATPVITSDRPWENEFIFVYGSVLRDPCDGLFKAWYRSAFQGYCYAVSKDGIEWEKPLFDIFPHDGRPTNRAYLGFAPEMLEKGEFNMDAVSVFVTPDDPDPQRRYKLFTFQAPLTKEAEEAYGYDSYGYYIAFSPDGIHWTPRPNPVLNRADDDPLMSDAHTCMYDPLKKRYIAFTKRHITRPDGTGDQGVIQRVRCISYSDDFVHWSKPRICLVPDDHDDRSVNLYNMSGFVYEGMYIGLLEVYYSSDDHPSMARMSDVQLISSRDGEYWWRAGDRKSFLSPSGRAGDWDAYMLHIQSKPPILCGDELWFYYGGRAHHHVPSNCAAYPEDRSAAGVGLSTLRRDGFVSYDAGPEEGTLTTKPILFERGDALHINADVRGELRAELISIEEMEAPRSEPAWRLRTGQPIDGFTRSDCRPLTGDTLDGILGWSGGDIGRFQGKLIGLRFYLNEASLYSFWIK